MRLLLDDRVRIIGNGSQKIFHYAEIGQEGYVTGYRNAMIIRRKLEKVCAYNVSVGRLRWVIAHEDVESVICNADH